MEFEEYIPKYNRLKSQIPVLVTYWVQIWLSDCLVRYWGLGGQVSFPGSGVNLTHYGPPGAMGTNMLPAVQDQRRCKWRGRHISYLRYFHLQNNLYYQTYITPPCHRN